LEATSAGGELNVEISDHQQSWGYEEGPSKEPWRHTLLVIADFNSILKPPALFNFRSIGRDHPLTVEPFQFSPLETVAYEGS
jgi:hypothetical protein